MRPSLKLFQVAKVLLALACGISCCTALSSIQATPQLLDFGDVGVLDSSGIQEITLQRQVHWPSPSATITLTSITAVEGSPDGQFTILANTCGLFAVGQATTCTIYLRANPTVAGTVKAVLQNTDRSMADGTFDVQPVTLTVNGVAPQLTLSPSFNFGDVALYGESAPKSFLLANTGSVRALSVGTALSIMPGTGATATTPQLKITGGTCTSTGVLPTGQSCTLTIVAAPNVAGKNTQQIVLRGPTGSVYASVAGLLVVKGVALDLGPLTATFPSPAPSPSPIIIKPVPLPIVNRVP